MTLSKQHFDALAGIVGATYAHQSPDRLLREVCNLCSASNPAFDGERFMAAVREHADHFGQAWRVPTTEAELWYQCEALKND